MKDTLILGCAFGLFLAGAITGGVLTSEHYEARNADVEHHVSAAWEGIHEATDRCEWIATDMGRTYDVSGAAR